MKIIEPETRPPFVPVRWTCDICKSVLETECPGDVQQMDKTAFADMDAFFLFCPKCHAAIGCDASGRPLGGREYTLVDSE